MVCQAFSGHIQLVIALQKGIKVQKVHTLSGRQPQEVELVGAPTALDWPRPLDVLFLWGEVGQVDIDASATEADQGLSVVVAACACICLQGPTVNGTTSKRSLAAALHGNGFMVDAQQGSGIVSAEHVGKNRLQILGVAFLQVPV